MGQCGVINWPEFNIILPQGIRRPKKKDGEIASQWSNQNTHNTRGDQDGKVGVSWAHLPLQTHQNYNSIKRDSH